MSELISGKEALIALANGSDVQVQCVGDTAWHNSTQWTVGELLRWQGLFRLKPRTIKLNGIEVPAPFAPKVGDEVWFLNDDSERGYGCSAEYNKDIKSYFGWWRTEGEIEQVVAALRSIFNESN